jgi:1-acyl-sn-glycerol-3-phosphate acyltransferase
MAVLWVILAVATLALIALWCRVIMENPRREFAAGMLWHLLRLNARHMHRMQVRGKVPDVEFAGPLILVSNHTAGVDPLLIQAACRFEVRWLMATDMRVRALEWLWNYAHIIFVDRSGRDSMGPREAIRHVKAGGVLGIFPEGGLERPPRTIKPFMAGVGLIIKRTGAPVLPVVVDGTPIADVAWASLVRRSRAVLTIQEPIRYGPEWGAEAITEDLRRRYVQWTGWPANDEPDPRVDPSEIAAKQQGGKPANQQSAGA